MSVKNQKEWYWKSQWKKINFKFKNQKEDFSSGEITVKGVGTTMGFCSEGGRETGLNSDYSMGNCGCVAKEQGGGQ